MSLPLVGAAGAARAQCTPAWSAYGGPHLDNGIFCITPWDQDGAGPGQGVVVGGGNFEHAGSTPVKFVGLYDGTAWRPMAQGVIGSVRAAGLYDSDGAGPIGPESVIGGFFSGSVARFDGSAWIRFGTGMSGLPVPEVRTVVSFSGDLIAGGQFLTAGGIPVQGLARWDGQSWHAFPDERAAGPEVLAVLDGVLYAGGLFFAPNGPTQFTGVLRWDNSSWVALGQVHPNEYVYALASYRGRIIAAGDFTNVGQRIAAFDGTSWSPVGSGLNGRVYALTAFDPDGSGPTPELLIAGGAFTEAGGQPANGIAAWDGTNWMPLGQGTSGSVRALTVWNGKLVVAGEFYSAGGLVSPGMAFWGCPTPPCYPNCDGSTAAPALNVGDFICFLNRYAAAEPYANCDGSTTPPVLNVGDFVCYLNRFAAGCP